jgi:hypothetical protein
MSHPNEPKFEDDFDCDSEPPEQAKYNPTLYDIASVKAHVFAQEYNPTTGTVLPRQNYQSLRGGYMAGFLDGFSHRFTTNDKVPS